MKISQYGALTSPAPADELVIVDVDDHTMAASGTTKNITAANLGLPLTPSGDTTGVTDTPILQAALNNGLLYLAASTTPFWINAPLVYHNGASVVGTGFAKSTNAAIIKQAAGANMTAPGTPALNGRGIWVSGTSYAAADAVLIPVTPNFGFYTNANDRGNFAASTVYAVNDVVFNPTGDNLVYICIAGYTSSATTPNNDTTHWQLVATVLYRCILAVSGSTTPDADATHWTQVTQTGLLVPYEWFNNQNFDGQPAVIENVQFDGNRTANPYSQCCGVIVLNFWTSVQQCMMQNMPGDGARYTDTTANGTLITSTSSENRFLSNKIVGVTLDGLRVFCQGTTANLDGFLEDCNISNCLTGINMDRGAGWQIRGNHLYGIGGNGINVATAFATKVLHNYVEQFGGQNVPSFFYNGISVNQLTGRGSHVGRNFVGSNDPNVNTSHYQLLSVSAGSGQTAQASCTDNVVAGPAVPANSLGLVYQIFGGGTLALDEDNNQVTSVATEAVVGGGVTAVKKTRGSEQVLGSIQPGNGTALGSHLYSGSGAPNITGSIAGDFYLRLDTPSTANQRLYVATAANTWTGIL